VNLTKALELDPLNKEIKANLTKVEEKLGGKPKEAKTGPQKKPKTQ